MSWATIRFAISSLIGVPKKIDALVEQARVDVKRALAAARLLDDHRDSGLTFRSPFPGFPHRRAGSLVSPAPPPRRRSSDLGVLGDEVDRLGHKQFVADHVLPARLVRVEDVLVASRPGPLPLRMRGRAASSSVTSRPSASRTAAITRLCLTIASARGAVRARLLPASSRSPQGTPHRHATLAMDASSSWYRPCAWRSTIAGGIARVAFATAPRWRAAKVVLARRLRRPASAAPHDVAQFGQGLELAGLAGELVVQFGNGLLLDLLT